MTSRYTLARTPHRARNFTPLVAANSPRKSGTEKPNSERFAAVARPVDEHQIILRDHRTANRDRSTRGAGIILNRPATRRRAWARGAGHDRFAGIGRRIAARKSL
jgi:hypothetical protein